LSAPEPSPPRVADAAAEPVTNPKNEPKNEPMTNSTTHDPLSDLCVSDTLDVLDNHLRSFHLGNLDGLMQDYTEDSVLFTPDGVLAGPAPIRRFMSRLFHEFAQPGASFEMRIKEVLGEVGYIVWTAETADHHYEYATDTFVVRGGRIAYQSFAGKVKPRV
jgi:hypothetical protein